MNSDVSTVASKPAWVLRQGSGLYTSGFLARCRGADIVLWPHLLYLKRVSFKLVTTSYCVCLAIVHLGLRGCALAERQIPAGSFVAPGSCRRAASS